MLYKKVIIKDDNGISFLSIPLRTRSLGNTTFYIIPDEFLNKRSSACDFCSVDMGGKSNYECIALGECGTEKVHYVLEKQLHLNIKNEVYKKNINFIKKNKNVKDNSSTNDSRGQSKFDYLKSRKLRKTKISSRTI